MRIFNDLKDLSLADIIAAMVTVAIFIALLTPIVASIAASGEPTFCYVESQSNTLKEPYNVNAYVPWRFDRTFARASSAEEANSLKEQLCPVLK